ncbi:hypothetical protein PCCS19_58820 [Paenibacillus sp. CCS19]|uniref:tetratricopeptide repeat-containing glycosyltransferase family 2 protein n=1 Tax=Paenibacillus sp. CCS19 TaxID=3158387 RepID=UPI00255D7DED|nr:glycosyltransferase [Paenibacillus cellulosilyticus]GMK42822.1 hypothetical protein PCCS19_58820 [Paenibacillus cellulosilyticus]
MAARRKLISLCMIVRDDEQGLARCLRSAQGVVDEAIVVVDASSADGTAGVARRYGAKVIERAWTGDFAAARNAGLDEAQGEWVLILDADEELSQGTAAGLRSLALHGQSVAGWLLPVWNMLGADEEDGVTINPVLRLFRNDRKHRFEGRIHEQIALSILRANPNARLALGDAVIRHYGYRPSVVAEKDKIRRNMRLLLQAVEEEPDNPFHRYNLGVEYLRAGMPQDALESFREAKGSPAFTQLSYAHLVFKYEVRSLQTLGRWKEAASVAEEGVRLFSDYADLWHTLAESMSRIGRRHRAIMAACYALRLGQPKGIYHTEEGMGSHRTAYLLGMLYETAGSYDAAAYWYSETLSMKPSLMPPLYRLCRMLRVVGRGSELPVLIERRFTVSTEEASVKIAAALLDSGCTAEAVIWLRRRAAEPAWGTASSAWLALAEASHAAAEGHWAEARRRVARALRARSNAGEKGIRAGADTRVETGMGTRTGAGREAGAEAGIGAVAGTGMGTDAGVGSEAGAETRGETRGETRAGADASLEKEAGAEAKTGAGAETGAGGSGYSAAVAYESLASLQRWLQLVKEGFSEASAPASAPTLQVEVKSDKASTADYGLATLMTGAVKMKDSALLERTLRHALVNVSDGCDEAAQCGSAALSAYADYRLREAEQLLAARSASSAARQVLRSARLLLAGCCSPAASEAISR